MAAKQLDFNSLLPSVRRLGPVLPPSPNSYSNVAVPDRAVESPRRSPLPFYKSDSISGPIQKPGVVPFLWEQSPGQPKDGFIAGGVSRRSLRGNGRSVVNSPNCSARAESCFMHYSMSGMSEDTASRASSRRISADLRNPDVKYTVESKGRGQRPLGRFLEQKMPNCGASNSWANPTNDARNRESDDDDDHDDKEEGEEDRKYDGFSQQWTKGCGILPRLCLSSPLKSRKNKRIDRKVDTQTRKASRDRESAWEELSKYKNLGLKGNRVSCDSNDPASRNNSKIHARKNCRSPAFFERKQSSHSEALKFPDPVKFSKFPSGSWLYRSLPRVSSKEQTLRSLFQKSSIADLPTSSVLFADVLARPASED